MIPSRFVYYLTHLKKTDLFTVRKHNNHYNCRVRGVVCSYRLVKATVDDSPDKTFNAYYLPYVRIKIAISGGPIHPIEKFLGIEYTNAEEFPLTFLKDNYHGALNLVQNRLLNRQENRINADEIIKILLATLRD